MLYYQSYELTGAMSLFKQCVNCGFEYTLKRAGACWNCGQSHFYGGDLREDDNSSRDSKIQGASIVSNETLPPRTLKDVSAISLLKCRQCGCQDNLPISIVCSKNTDLLIDAGWGSLIALIVSLYFTGFYTFTNNTAWPVLIESYLLLVIAFSMFLRKYPVLIAKTTFFMAITLPFIFYQEIQDFPEIVSKISIVILNAGIVYLLFAYFNEWYESCEDSNVSLVSGIPVVSLSIYILSLALVIYKPVFISNAIINFVENQMKYREALIGATIAFIMVLSLYYATRRPIPKPVDVFKVPTDISNLKNHGLPFPFSVIFDTFSFIYKHVSQVLKFIINTAKIVLEYIIKFTINYSIELLQTVKSEIIVFSKTLFFFAMRSLFPIVILGFVFSTTKLLSIYVRQYIFNETIQLLLSIGIMIIKIFVGAFFYIWFLTRFPIGKTFKSVLSSKTSIGIILFFAIIITSWLVWGSSKVIKINNYSGLGNFTVASSIILAMVVGFIGLRSLSKQKN